MTDQPNRDKKYFLTAEQIRTILEKDANKTDQQIIDTLDPILKPAIKNQYNLHDLKTHYNLATEEFEKAYDIMANIYANRGLKIKKTVKDKAKLNKKNSIKESANSINLKAQITVLAEDIKDKQDKLLALVAKLNK